MSVVCLGQCIHILLTIRAIKKKATMHATTSGTAGGRAKSDAELARATKAADHKAQKKREQNALYMKISSFGVLFSLATILSGASRVRTVSVVCC